MARDETTVDEPGFLERQRAARPWFDHLMRAADRYQSQKGDYYAAGITYFSVLALVPLLMVAFAVAGFVLAGNPGWLDDIKAAVTENVPGSLGDTLNGLIDSAISSRSAVGVFGLLGAAYAGLGWMANVRDALTAMWESVREPPSGLAGTVKTKLRDAAALLGLAAALVITFGASALSSGPIARSVVDLLGLGDVTGVGTALRLLSLVLSIVATWAVLAWVIARLPREPVAFRSAIAAAAIGALVFEVFKQLGAVYLTAVTGGPAGVAFGPIIGLLVFVFMSSRVLLFCTAWAATTRSSLELAYVPPPDPAVIAPRVQVGEGLRLREGAALVGVGALSALGLSALLERNRR
ncbi:inner membrane protein YhjD [Rhodococcus triatomae]|uniref:Membrane protein n=1 Tax=Rhodococcus triatomae TaxID=300028 RepID=A0A1G8FK00_9NOCA|nr:YhjD/YihY/BrkB family envelope integrity protein [Rhodococcus triatomae]QNG19503.1 inner membrane protein YhjD [Rhodococcus triatomae]QNG24582.1 inner membrane protein YhjD [Rhodococcus triatomae]SDH82369.1 membrane protein [Rhodococcus triatomae]